MGRYVIPGAKSTIECAMHAQDSFTPGREWYIVADGVLFIDPKRSDEECAALYDGFNPSGKVDQEVEWPLPQELRIHAIHLRDYLAAGTVTNADTVHVVKDLIRAVFYMNKRIGED